MAEPWPSHSRGRGRECGGFRVFLRFSNDFPVIFRLLSVDLLKIWAERPWPTHTPPDVDPLVGRSVDRGRGLGWNISGCELVSRVCYFSFGFLVCVGGSGRGAGEGNS